MPVLRKKIFVKDGYTNADGTTYDEIIGLPRPGLKFHPPMARGKRAAQFAAFDALAGYGEAIREAERETEEKVELSEDMGEMLDVRLAVIGSHIKEQPRVVVTYFLPDERKAGGRYVTVSGKVKVLDGVKRVMVLTDGTRIPIGDVRMIEGEVFRGRVL